MHPLGQLVVANQEEPVQGSVLADVLEGATDRVGRAHQLAARIVAEHGLRQAASVARRDAGEELALGAEVVEQDAFGDPGPVRDLGGRRLVVALRGEELARGREQELALLFRPAAIGRTGPALRGGGSHLRSGTL